MKNGAKIWERKNEGYYVARMIYGITMCIRKLSKNEWEYDVSTDEYTYYNGTCGSLPQAKVEAYERYQQLLENHKSELIQNRGC
jgi:hypothetical protein